MNKKDLPDPRDKKFAAREENRHRAKTYKDRPISTKEDWSNAEREQARERSKHRMNDDESLLQKKRNSRIKIWNLTKQLQSLRRLGRLNDFLNQAW